jgi:hypothetical protein
MPALFTPVAQQPTVHHACFNCRVYERLECDVPVACQPAAAFGKEESRWEGTIRDISQGGVRLTLQRRFEPGTGLAVELPPLDNGDARTCFLKVMHVKRQLDGLWSLGCKFISELSEDEVKRLVARTQQAERDRSNESHCTTHTGRKSVANVHFQVALSSATLFECVVKQMVVPDSWPLAAGQTVTISGGKASARPWKLQLKVEDCGRQREGWCFRGQVLNPPSATALLQALGQFKA